MTEYVSRTPWRKIPLASRFWLRVWERGSCWEWRGARNPQGYGKFCWYGKKRSAHIFAFIAAKGAIPPGLTVDHLCRHPWCVRPTHLDAVPIRTNLLRGRGAPARNARKRHCVHGHPFSPENTYL